MNKIFSSFDVIEPRYRENKIGVKIGLNSALAIIPILIMMALYIAVILYCMENLSNKCFVATKIWHLAHYFSFQVQMEYLIVWEKTLFIIMKDLFLPKRYIHIYIKNVSLKYSYAFVFQVQIAFKKFDTNGDNRLNYREFCEMIRKHAEAQN